MLRAENITKYYGDFRALDGVNINISENEFVSLIGPNGAGKTTLLNVLTGHYRPDIGKVYFKDIDITGEKPERLCKMGIARSFQLITLFDGLTVHEVLCVAIVSRLGKGKNFFIKMEHEREINEEASAIAKLFNLSDKKNFYAGKLPHGDKKLLDIASAFALHPEIILLDEATSGVATSDKHQIIETLITASKQVGIKSIFQIEHDMDIVFKYSDRIIAIREGKILLESTPKELQSDQRLYAMILGRQV
ncbi:MAG: ABC transporter ATP-binding protein [Bacteroidia bacterium]|nr:ABC transporter ATP-binding protein [Bacteroidia bacterium]